MKPLRPNRFLSAALVTTGFALSLCFAQAANFYWDGGTGNIVEAGDAASAGTTGNWDTTLTNWDDGSNHVAWPTIGTDNDAIFGGTAGIVTLTSAITANDLTFNTTGYTVTGNTLTLNGGTAPTITTGSGITATIGSIIGGSAGLTTGGTGTLVLTGANNYTGGTNISSGSTLQVGNGGLTAVLGAGEVTNNGNLAFNVGGTGGSTYLVSNTVNGTGSLTATAATGVSLAFSGDIGGTTALSSITMTSNGTTVNNVGNKITANITTTENQTYNGYTFAGSGTGTTFTSTAGSISFNSDLTGNNFGTDTITIDTSGGNGNVFFGNNVSYNGVATGSTVNSRYNIIKALNVNAGTGMVTLAGNAASYLGTIGGQITAGSIYLANNLTMSPLSGNLSSTMVFNGAVSGAAGVGIAGGTGTVDPWNPLFSNAGAGTGKWTFKNDVTLTGAVNTGANAIVAFDDATATNHITSSAITGSGSVQKIGAGTRTLTNANTYTGTTTVTAGTLNLSNANALSGSTFAGGAGSLVFDSSVATHAFVFGGISGSSNLTLADNAGSPNAVALTVGNNNQAASYSGNLSGVGSLTKIGTSAQTLSGTNTYTGTTTVNANSGILQFANAASFYNSTTGTVSSENAAKLTVNSGSTAAFNVGGTGEFNATDIGTFLGASTGGVGLKSGASLGLDPTIGNFSYSTISNTANGSLSLTKLGANTLTLSGASNTYTGNTTVAAGILTLSGNLGGGNYEGNIANAGIVNFNNTGSQALTGQINGAGTYNLNAGAVTLSGGGSGGANWNTGSTAAGTAMTVSGGTYSLANYQFTNTANSGTATYTQSGGTVNVSSAFFLGQYNGGGGSSANNIANITGGSLTVGSLTFYKWASSQLNISGTGGVTAGTLDIGWVDGSQPSSINVGNGTAGGNFAWGDLTVRASRQCTLNLNGGTIQATKNNAAWIPATEFTTMAVKDAGGTINNGGFNIGIAQTISHGGGAATDGGLTFTGNGATTLSGSSSYNGTTTIRNGTLIAGISAAVSANGAFGNASSAIALGDANSISSNLSPSLLTGGAFTVGRAITVGSSNAATSGVYTIGGNTTNTSDFSGAITLNQSLTVSQVTGGTLNLTGNITSGSSGTQTLTINNVGAVSQSTGGIGGGTGTIALAKLGAGTLTLSGTNTFAGDTRITAGKIALGNNLALQNSAYDTTGSTGAIGLNVTGFTTPTLGGLKGSVNLATAITGYTGVTSLTLNPLVGSLTYSGVIADGATGMTLIKTGAGTQILSGNNSYTGTTTINQGTLEINYGGNAFTYAGGFSGSGGVLRLAGSGPNGSSGLTLTGSSTFSGDVDISGARIFLNSSSGNALSGANIIFKTGFWPFHDLSLMQNEQIADTSVLRFETTNSTLYELRINGKTETVGGLQCTNQLAIIENAGYDGGNDNNIAAGKLTVDVANGASYTYNGSLRNQNGGSGNGALSFEKKGLGTQILTRDISYTGGTTVSAGTLYLQGTTDFRSAVSLNGGVLAFDNNSLGTGTVTMNGGTLQWATGNTQDVSSKLTLVNGTTAVLNTQTNNVTLANALGTDTSAGLTKSGTGTLTLTAANTYSGGTTIKNGSIVLSGGNDRLATTGSVILGDTGTSGKLVLGNTTDASNQTLAGLTTTGSGGSVVGAHATNNSLLTMNIASGTNTYDGKLGGNGTNENKLALTKTGAGTLTLTGTNSYTGATNVDSGKLVVNGNISTSTLTTVNSGGTLGGLGHVGALTVLGTGIVAPGNSPGVLTVDGNYTQAAGTLSLELNGTAAGTDYDQLAVNGSVTLGGALTATISGGYTNGDLLFILANDGTDAISGIFSGMSNLSTTTFGGQDWQISYFGNYTNNGNDLDDTFIGGNDVVLMAVPEPAAALLGSLGLLALLRRRRN